MLSPIKSFPRVALLLAASLVPAAVNAAVTPVEGGFQVDYYVSLAQGTSNGNDIQDTLIFEWNESGDFSAAFGPDISASGSTLLSHVIDFDPDSALVLGWGAGIAGVGDEKDHLFMLTNSAFTREVTGLKWSEAFPGVPPEPRTGHNAMIQLLQAAATGDGAALGAITSWVEREATGAAFDPSGNFRVIEWTVAQPIDIFAPVPTMTSAGLALLVLSLLLFARSRGGMLLNTRR